MSTGLISKFTPGQLVRYIGTHSGASFCIVGKSSLGKESFHAVVKGQLGIHIKSRPAAGRENVLWCEEVLFDDVVVSLGAMYLEAV